MVMERAPRRSVAALRSRGLNLAGSGGVVLRPDRRRPTSLTPGCRGEVGGAEVEAGAGRHGTHKPWPSSPGTELQDAGQSVSQPNRPRASGRGSHPRIGERSGGSRLDGRLGIALGAGCVSENRQGCGRHHGRRHLFCLAGPPHMVTWHPAALQPVTGGISTSQLNGRHPSGHPSRRPPAPPRHPIRATHPGAHAQVPLHPRSPVVTDVSCSTAAHRPPASPQLPAGGAQ